MGAGHGERHLGVLFKTREIWRLAFGVGVKPPLVVCVPAVGIGNVGLKSCPKRCRTLVIAALFFAVWGEESGHRADGWRVVGEGKGCHSRENQS